MPPKPSLSRPPSPTSPLRRRAAPPKLPLTFLAAFFAGLAAPPPAEAQPAPAPPAEATPLAEITTSATRTERRTDAVPGTVTVTTGADAQMRGVRDLKDLFRFEVDVAVRAASPRFGAALGTGGRAGNEGINIRGLEGNQVLMLVDGVRVPQAFSFGAFATGRGDYLSVDTLQAAEVLRGPASAQFGSDGLAGALALRTIEPADVLKPGRNFGGFARVAFDDLSDTRALNVAGAWRAGPLQALLVVGTRRYGELQSQATNEALNANRTAPNPLDATQNSVLAKLRWAVTPAQQLGITFEGIERRIDTDVISARSAPPLAATSVLKLDAKDTVERRRASLEWKLDDLNAAFIQQAEARVYVQDAKTTQLSLEDRNTATDRVRDNRYRERVAGFSALAVASVGSQRFSAGVDGSRTNVTALRDGTVPPFGETFPTRPFPDTDYRLLGAFVQDEIEFGSGRASFTLIPAIRLDRYELEPDPTGYTGGTVVKLADSAATPRLGVLWRVSEALTPYAQWSRGFRAPTPEQVNNGFTNVASGYRSVGNPNLKPERAESVEIGLRGRLGPQGALRWQIAAFDNRYEDFISQEQVGGSFTPADPAVFQSINLAEARIAGAEARVRWTLAPGWAVNAAAASTRGTSSRGGVVTRLATIEPAKATLGIEHERHGWALRAAALFVRGKQPGDIPAATPASFAAPSYTTLDVSASYRPMAALTLYLSVANLFDEKYWRYSDVRGVSSTSAVLDAFTAPGRSVVVQARLDF